MPPTEGSTAPSAHALPVSTMNASEKPLVNGHDAAGGPVRSPGTSDEPPQLDQSWRTSSANKPMGKLLQRLANQCLKDLRDTVTSMAETPIEAPPPSNSLAVGSPTTTVDKSAASVAKKLQLMRFAHGQRDRFIKALVLADWSKREHDMARLVDLKVWQEKEINAQRSAVHFIGQIKRDMFAAKMPNPNIEAALEILSTGKASRQPHLGYLPPPRLTARQLLRTLQDMNVTLMTRLNLHEELPFHCREYSVANGRATFRVPGEFEVDLSVADEDPASPFYFIDLRLSFTPAARNLPDGLRAVLEAHSNQALATKGLQGCYDFLHNFILTHKLNTLREQALELVRGNWFGCLRIEDYRRVHRVLVVQYWTGVAGRKSWIELGISTGKSQKSSSLTPPTPRLTLRWFRSKGDVITESDEEAITDIDWSRLDFEKLLRAVLARHISWSLGQIRTHLLKQAGPGAPLTVQLQTSQTTPEDCSLELFLPGLPSRVLVRHDPVTGHLVLHQPSTPTAAQAQHRLANEPAHDPLYLAQMLAALLANDLRDRIHRPASLLGWQALALPRQDPKVMTSLFGQGVLTHRVYRCHAGWRQGSCALAVTLGLGGEKWWAVRLDEHPAPVAGRPVVGPVIASARHLRTPLYAPTATSAATDTSAAGSSKHQPSPISRARLLQIERAAAAEFSFASLARDLVAEKLPYRVQTVKVLTAEREHSKRGSQRAVERAAELAMFIQPADGKRAAATAMGKESDEKESVRCSGLGALGPLRISFGGLTAVPTNPETASDDDTNATDTDTPLTTRFEIRLAITNGRLKHLQKYLSPLTNTTSSSRQSHTIPDLTLSASGAALTILCHAPFGGSGLLARLRARLAAVARLDGQLAVLATNGLRCEGVTLEGVRFSFGKSAAERLEATLSYPSDGMSAPVLELAPREKNPMLRVRGLVEGELRRRAAAASATTMKDSHPRRRSRDADATTDKDDALQTFVTIASATLPLLRALDQVENSFLPTSATTSDEPPLTIHAHTSHKFVLAFRAPFPPVRLSIGLRQRVEGSGARQEQRDTQSRSPPRRVLWRVALMPTPPPGSNSMPAPKVFEAFKELFKTDAAVLKGGVSAGAADADGDFAGREGFWGAGTFLVATTAAVGKAVEKAVSVVRGFEGDEAAVIKVGDASATKVEGGAAAPATTTGSAATAAKAEGGANANANANTPVPTAAAAGANATGATASPANASASNSSTPANPKPPAAATTNNGNAKAAAAANQVTAAAAAARAKLLAQQRNALAVKQQQQQQQHHQQNQQQQRPNGIPANGQNSIAAAQQMSRQLSQQQQQLLAQRMQQMQQGRGGMQGFPQGFPQPGMQVGLQPGMGMMQPGQQGQHQQQGGQQPGQQQRPGAQGRPRQEVIELD